MTDVLVHFFGLPEISSGVIPYKHAVMFKGIEGDDLKHFLTAYNILGSNSLQYIIQEGVRERQGVIEVCALQSYH